MAKAVIMVCENCLSRNKKTYTNENRIKRLELKIYCPKCNKHVIHKETR